MTDHTFIIPSCNLDYMALRGNVVNEEYYCTRVFYNSNRDGTWTVNLRLDKVDELKPQARGSKDLYKQLQEESIEINTKND